MTEAPGTRGFKARLYPTAEQADRLNRWAGSLCFVWNRLLEAEQAEYAISKKFIPKAELRRRAGRYEDCQRRGVACRLAGSRGSFARLNGALRACFRHRKAGRKWSSPKPKKKFVREAGIYCVGQTTTFAVRTVPRNVYWYAEERRGLRRHYAQGRSESRGTPSGLFRC
jgi:transposase